MVVLPVFLGEPVHVLSICHLCWMVGMVLPNTGFDIIRKRGFTNGAGVQNPIISKYGFRVVDQDENPIEDAEIIGFSNKTGRNH